MHDIINNLAITQAVAPQVIQAAALDTGNIDMQGFETLCFAVLVGNIVDTLDADNRIDLKIEHGDATDAYAACTDDDVLGALIKAAREMCEGWTGLCLVTRNYAFTADG